jgi:hypothetical protein
VADICWYDAKGIPQKQSQNKKGRDVAIANDLHFFLWINGQNA